VWSELRDQNTRLESVFQRLHEVSRLNMPKYYHDLQACALKSAEQVLHCLTWSLTACIRGDEILWIFFNDLSPVNSGLLWKHQSPHCCQKLGRSSSTSDDYCVGWVTVREWALSRQCKPNCWTSL